MIKPRLVRYLVSHPLNRRTRFRALPAMLRWTLATRLLPGYEIIIPFANHAKLAIVPGHWGSEANALCGLRDFFDMGFLLHFLRPDDLFCDVGARSMSFEPVRSTYAELLKNVAINQIAARVGARSMAVGSAAGRLTLTGDQDTQNHVVAGNDDALPAGTVTVATDTLDNVLAASVPQLLKVDVEGWEHEVFAGAAAVLRDPNLFAIIVELNQSGKRYGFDDDVIHQTLLDQDFATYRYRPFERRLVSLDKRHNPGGNTLYLRNLEAVNARLQSAPAFSVRGMHI
mgnify:CR=1 FL=1